MAKKVVSAALALIAATVLPSVHLVYGAAPWGWALRLAVALACHDPGSGSGCGG